MISIRKFALIAVAAVCVLYARALVGAVTLGTNSLGLISLSSRSASEYTLNPLSENVSLISPGNAEWILMSFDWPYSSLSETRSADAERMPELYAATTFWGVKSNESEVTQRIQRLMQHFIDRGASIEERYMGLTPLHEAIISANAEAASFLIERGADPSATIRRPGRKHDGLNSLEFAQLLHDKDPEWMKETLAVIAQTEKLAK